MIHRLAPSRPAGLGRFVSGVLAVVVLLTGVALVVWLVLRPGTAPVGGEKQEPLAEGQWQEINPSPEEAPLRLPRAVDLSKFAVTATKTAALAREQGGTVDLGDGTSLEVPAGALSIDASITLRRLLVPDLEGFGTLIDVDLGGATLSAEVTLTLPCPAPEPTPDKDPLAYRVYHIQGDALTAVPARYNPQRHVAQVRTRTCSPFAAVVWGVTIGVATAAAVVYYFVGPALTSTSRADLQAELGRDPAPPVLEVPYYPQDGAEWCWAASAQMEAKYAGREVEIWSLARAFRAGPRDGMALFGVVHNPMASSSLPGMLKDQGLATEYNVLIPWKNYWALSLFLVKQLRAGHPVYLSLPSYNHAVVAVGFDASGVYIHDPSDVNVFRPLLSRQEDRPGRVAGYLTWETFVEMCTAGTNPVGVQNVRTLTVTPNSPPAAAASPVTVALVPDDLVFEHPEAPWDKQHPLRLGLAWDGRVAPGYLFVAGPDSPPEGVSPPHATKSDRVCRLTVRLANAGREKITASVSATLGGRPLGVRKDVPLNPYSVVEDVSLTEDGDARETPFGGKSRLPTELLSIGKDVPLIVEARVGDQPVDHRTLKIDVGPSRVEGLDVKKQDDGSRLLTWKRVPEPDVSYHVYLVSKTPGCGVEKGPPTKEPKWPIDPVLLSAEGPKWFYVVAVTDDDNHLSGSPSDLLEVGEGKKSVYVRQAPDLGPNGGKYRSDERADRGRLVEATLTPGGVTLHDRRGPDDDHVKSDWVFEYTWDRPPAVLLPDQPVRLTITGKAGGAKQVDVSRFTSSPCLASADYDLADAEGKNADGLLVHAVDTDDKLEGSGLDHAHCHLGVFQETKYPTVRAVFEIRASSGYDQPAFVLTSGAGFANWSRGLPYRYVKMELSEQEIQALLDKDKAPGGP